MRFEDAGATLDELRQAFVKAGKSRGWSFEWPERSGYAHGELSELVEAVRGKHGDITDEAADTLMTALFGLVPDHVPMADVLARCREKITLIAARKIGVDRP